MKETQATPRGASVKWLPTSQVHTGVAYEWLLPTESKALNKWTLVICTWPWDFPRKADKRKDRNRLFLTKVPNLWIRYGAVGFITVVAHQISTADVYCKLMPYLDPYITQPIIQVCMFQLGINPPFQLCPFKKKVWRVLFLFKLLKI